MTLILPKRIPLELPTRELTFPRRRLILPRERMNQPGTMPGAAFVFDASGSITPLSTPGTYSFTVPRFANSIVFTLWGPGAGGQSIGGSFGTAGTATTIADLSLSAGAGVNGTGGTATGGDTNTAGNNQSSGVGGAGHNGYGTGGNGAYYPGGEKDPPVQYAGGGGGAKLIKTLTVSQLAWGTALSLVLGAPGVGYSSGSNGRLEISWS